jgi:trigger factor
MDGLEKNNRPPIPLPVKRLVRQQCGFGCVFCGCPIYDYDHIEEYAKNKEHDATNLVLICPNHHREKTRGLISKESVLEAKRNAPTFSRTQPYNIKSKVYSLRLGDTYFKHFPGIAFDLLNNQSFFSISFDRGLLINCRIMDQNESYPLIIESSEYTLDTKFWDIEFTGKSLIFRYNPGNIFLKIFFNIEKNEIQMTGSFYLDEYSSLEIKEKSILFQHKNKFKEIFSGNEIMDGVKCGLELTKNIYEGRAGRKGINARRGSIHLQGSKIFGAMDVGVALSMQGLISVL